MHNDERRAAGLSLFLAPPLVLAYQPWLLAYHAG